MATVTVLSGPWPVGTTVSIHKASARHDGGAPGDAAIASGTVGAASNSSTTLTVTDAGIVAGGRYVGYAKVGSNHVYAQAGITTDIEDIGRVVGTGDTTDTSQTILNASASSGSFQIGQRISGPGIRPGTLINNIVSTTLSVDQPCSATANTVAIQGEGGKSWVAKVKTRKAAIGTT